MEALKELVDVVKSLPDVAVWLFVLFFCYKVAIVGSVYGVIRFVVGRICEAYEARMQRPPPDAVIRLHIDGIIKAVDILEINQVELIDFLIRMKNVDVTDSYNTSKYLKRRDIEYVTKAVAEKQQRDLQAAREKGSKGGVP